MWMLFPAPKASGCYEAASAVRGEHAGRDGPERGLGSNDNASRQNGRDGA